MHGVVLSRILPPKTEKVSDSVTTSLRMPKAMMKELDEIASASGYTRSEVMLHFMRWAIQEYEKEKKLKR